MINPQNQLDQLRRTLQQKGLSDEDIRFLVDQAAQDISVALVDLAYDTLNSMEQLGIQTKSTEFATDLVMDISPVDINIRTFSGRSDFSEPPFPMMPRLLKNAKVAKDGSLYKVIPIQSKSVPTNSIIEAQMALQKMNEVKRNSLKEQARAKRELPTLSTEPGLSVRDYLAKRKHSQQVTATHFRTVSSKQDPATQWVNPGKDLNFSKDIHEANAQLQQRASEIISDIIKMYEGVA